MANSLPVSNVDRRKFLKGRGPGRAKQQTNKLCEVASLLVQVRPERLETVARIIARLPGSQIYRRSPQGKLVVVIEADSIGDIGITLNLISSLPHVLSAALVFHGTDEG
jgi:periplasmic nitrate reductase NapD